MEKIPILKISNFLIVSLQEDVHDQLAVALQKQLTEEVSRTGARGVLIDISCLDMVDSFMGRCLASITDMLRILDAETVVIGMQPAVAITLAELGLTLPGMLLATSLERGMEVLEERLAFLEKRNR